MNQFNNIPLELRLLPQWIVWDKDKVPCNPFTKQPANVNDPETWTTFENCYINIDNYNGIGFVFTDNDPYFGIDLDDTQGDQIALDRQIKIYREFDSYSEISPSGKGLHIIGKGTVPQGRRRSHIEIYSSQRYFTMTGNVYPSGQAKPIAERQSMLMQLWKQMGAGAPATYLYKGDDNERFTDNEIIEQGRKAVNGDKFEILLSGKWQDNYPSQSEADFAFIDIIAFYTQNRKQIERIYRNSNLGQTDKKRQRKDYITWMINKSFDRMLPPLDFDGFKIALESKINEQHRNNNNSSTSNNSASNVCIQIADLSLNHIAGSSNGKTADFDSANNGSSPLPASTSVAQLVEPVAHNRSDASSNLAASTIILPPGLLGEIAQFIYAAAPRPVPEIALAAAIGLMAGVTGRAYNISGTGLNQYVLLLAATGSGKEAMALGIDRLMNTIRLQVPTSTHFIGPSEIASGQALIKHLSKTSQCFVSILGEFGLRLEAMSSPTANSAEKALKRMLLDLYNKSGHGQMFRPSIFADSDKNIATTESPAFSILGESTPERFYGALNEDMISEGLLPRFMLIEYNGPRPPLSEFHLQAKPSFELIERFASLVAYCESTMHQKKIININCDQRSDGMLRKFDKFCDQQINGTNKEVLRQLWNRAHIKALKISGLMAVGCNMLAPIVIPQYVDIAINMVQSDIRALSAKFEAGEIGLSTNESKQLKELLRIIREFVVKDWSEILKYFDNEKLHKEKIIPYAYLSRRLIATSVFRTDKVGATNAIKRTIQIMIESDKIREIGKQELASKFGTTQRCFIVSNPAQLFEKL